MANKKEQSMRPSPISGTPPPVHTRFGQPGGNRRHPGCWRIEDSARFKLEKMIQLSESELKRIANDADAPYFERKLAVAINKADWKVLDGIMNQVYGKPKETVETIDKTPKSIKIELLEAKKKNANKK